jgi:hypothetical protein
MTFAPNRRLLSDDTSLGQEVEDLHGSPIVVHRDPADSSTLWARFGPDHAEGQGGVTVEGELFTALDCLSTWVATLLGPNRSAAWLLRSASVTYHSAPPRGRTLMLSGRIVGKRRAWGPLVVHTEARGSDGALCVEADFKVAPVPSHTLRLVAGIDRLPENWETFQSDSDRRSTSAREFTANG